MTTLTIAWNHPRQRIDGFGTHSAFQQARNLRLYPEADQQRILDILFSTEGDGAGFSMIRNIIGDSGEWGSDVNGPTPSIWPQPGVENLEGDEDQIWFMREARSRGCNSFVATAWSPPAWMKTNNDVANGGRLRRDHYRQFAEYLAAYVRIYRDVHDLEIAAISPANEPDWSPDYSSCLWNGKEFAEFYRDHLGPVWDRENIQAKVFGPETIGFNDAKLHEYRDLFADDVADSRLDIVALHGYDNLEIARLDDRLVRGRDVWMSELTDIGWRDRVIDSTIDDGLVVAKRVHDYLTAGNVNAFIHFWAISYLTDHNSASILLDLESLTYEVTKRVRAIGHFSRFVRPGSQRFEASVEGDGCVLASVYNDPSGRAVIVFINMSPLAADVRLKSAERELRSLLRYETDADNDLASGGVVQASEMVTLRPRSITTLVETDVDETRATLPAK